MNKIYKVTHLEDNNLENNKDILKKSQGAMIINFIPPIMSLPFLKLVMNEDNEKVLIMLAEKTNVTYNDGKFYDKDGNESDINSILLGIVQHLYNVAESTLKKDDDSGLFIGNLVKLIIEQKIIPKLNFAEKERTIMSVEDLMTKLYESNESRSIVK